MSYNRYYKNAKLNIFFEKTKVMERFLFQVALYVIAKEESFIAVQPVHSCRKYLQNITIQFVSAQPQVGLSFVSKASIMSSENPHLYEIHTMMGFVSSDILSEYRKHAFLAIMFVAAIITPPDLMTLVLVTIPLYLLFELSIRVVRWVEK